VHDFAVLQPEINYFSDQIDVSAVRGHPRSLILLPIESAYATSDHLPRLHCLLVGLKVVIILH